MKKAILVVSFGTTYADTRKLTIDKIEERVKETYKDYEIRRAFTSHGIIHILKKRDNIYVDTPKEALIKLKEEGFEEIIVQPLHIIPGEEFDYVTNTVEIFKTSFKAISIGRPLLFYNAFQDKVPDDYEIAVNAVKSLIKDDQITIFMGHGTAHIANACYSCLEHVFKDKGYNNVYIANVEGYPEISTILNRIKKDLIIADLKNKEVTLIPLMLVAGDHAKNDMAGDEEDSFKSILQSEGFKVNVHLHGLGELESFQDIYIKHIEDVILNKYGNHGKTKKFCSVNF